MREGIRLERIEGCDEIKNGSKPKKKDWIESETKDFKQRILDSGYTQKTKRNILKLYEEIGVEVFGNSRVVDIPGCSEVTATSYLKRMEQELKVIIPVGQNDTFGQKTAHSTAH